MANGAENDNTYCSDAEEACSEDDDRLGRLESKTDVEYYLIEFEDSDDLLCSAYAGEEFKEPEEYHESAMECCEEAHVDHE